MSPAVRYLGTSPAGDIIPTAKPRHGDERMDISQITKYLFVGAHPEAADAPAIRELGIRLVISMVGFRRPPAVFSVPPLRLLWFQTFDTVVIPIPLKTLQCGVEAAIPVIQEGHAVLVFCMYGRHRSIAMAAAILIAMGYSADEAMRMLETGRTAADPRARHIRRQIERFEKRWHRLQGNTAEKGRGNV